jgi:alkylation response protein AidB-like acyl-CoA dehydrogenase
MHFTLTAAQQTWMQKGGELGRALPSPSTAETVMAAAAGKGLLDPTIDLLGVATAVSAMAFWRPAAAVALALHSTVMRAVVVRSQGGGSTDSLDPAGLVDGGVVGALALSSDDRPVDEGGRLRGHASWAAPLTPGGIVLVGASRRGAVAQSAGVYAASLADARVSITAVETAGLEGVTCGHVDFAGAPGLAAGEAREIMASIRVLLAAAGLGMGRRALHEALQASRRYAKTGPGGEQTLHGLLADTATELDAAMLLIWKAASASPSSLAGASMAKLAATEATQRAVLRATQVVGADSFAHGHPIERLAQDVRALELFAGRTEALREAVAEEMLPALLRTVL